MGRRTLLLTLWLAGCASTDSRPPETPVVIDATKSVPFVEAVTQLRLVGNRLIEDYYRNDLDRLGTNATTLERAAESLKIAQAVPEKFARGLPATADAFKADAEKLRALARAPDDRELTELIQRINSRVRDLRYEN